MSGFAVGDRLIQSSDIHADWIAAYAEAGRYRLVGASAVGQSHRADNRPRDDAFAARAAGPWVALAVSDGVGSRPQSRYGSTYAVEALCEQMLRIALASGAAAQKSSGAAHAERGHSPELASNAVSVSGAKGGRSAWVVTRTQVAREPEDEEARDDTPVEDPAPPVEDPVSPPEETPPVLSLSVNDVPEAAFLSGPMLDSSGKQHAGQGTFSWSAPAAVRAGSGSPLSASEIRQAFQKTRDGLEQFAQVAGMEVRAYSCTLLGMIVNTQTGDAAVGHIGDGAIVGYSAAGAARRLLTPPTPEMPGETYSFTSSQWQSHLAVRVLEPEETCAIATFFLMTDGVAESCLYPPPEDILLRWAGDVDREVRQDAPAQAAVRLLQWLATYTQRGNRDDRTLLLFYRSGSPTDQTPKQQKETRAGEAGLPAATKGTEA